MKKLQKVLRSFALEVVIYGALVSGYAWLVTHYLAGTLKSLYDGNRFNYAVVALLLMIAQGFLLQFFTTLLLSLVRKKTD